MSKPQHYSLLELASVREGDSVATTLANSVAYARHRSDHLARPAS
ncbi:hypothetical protein D777_03296 [Marinobacter nitratireducens]|uniref:Uncharacterized protein n=1 Tax=Marinobacter nitratireducens TaxID=1137280 RepID=A0A072NAS0_9GAMM|nr:hypothetical protein D777_03296 [Marinobacter nitratireducens]